MKKILLAIFFMAATHLFGQPALPSAGKPAGGYKIIAYYTGNGETIQQSPVKKLTHII